MIAPQRRSGATRVRRRTLPAIAACIGLLAAMVGLSSAGAQDVDDARAEAAAIAADLSATRSRIVELAEEHNRAAADLERARADVEANQAALDQNQQALDQAEARLRDYAVQAYVAGGSLQELDGFFGGEAGTVDRRLNYIDTAAGDEQQVFDELARTRQQVDRQLGRLHEAQAAAVTEQARIDAAKRDAETLEATTVDLLDQAEGRLSTLVAEAEARQAEEERRAAQEAARQAGAQLALSAAAAAGTDGAATAAPAGDDAPMAPAAAAPPAATPAQPPTQPAAPPPAPAASYSPPPGLRPEAAAALSAAMSQLGVPYVFGGASPAQGFDCSGLMYWSYAQAGVRLSRPADYQRDDAIRIRYEDLQPGDLVFYGEPPSHNGMYIGGDQIINAPQTGDVVSVKNMFYSSKPMTYGRVA